LADIRRRGSRGSIRQVKGHQREKFTGYNGPPLRLPRPSSALQSAGCIPKTCLSGWRNDPQQVVWGQATSYANIAPEFQRDFSDHSEFPTSFGPLHVVCCCVNRISRFPKCGCTFSRQYRVTVAPVGAPLSFWAAFRGLTPCGPISPTRAAFRAPMLPVGGATACSRCGWPCLHDPERVGHTSPGLSTAKPCDALGGKRKSIPSPARARHAGQGGTAICGHPAMRRRPWGLGSIDRSCMSRPFRAWTGVRPPAQGGTRPFGPRSALGWYV
jgi:hypothetical protein